LSCVGVGEEVIWFCCWWDVNCVLVVIVEEVHFSTRRDMSRGDNFVGWKELEFPSSDSASGFVVYPLYPTRARR
jgi:hypothetical protein